MTIFRTCHFVSGDAAIDYYMAQEGSFMDALEHVKQALREGSIHIGRPPLRPGDKLVMLDGGKRYGISFEDKAK